MGKDKQLFHDDNFLISMGKIILSSSDNTAIESQFKLADLVLNIITDGIYLTDIDLNIKYVNSSAIKMIGYSREELLSKTVKDIDPVISMEQINRKKNNAIIGQASKFKTKHQKKDGMLIDIEITSYPYTVEKKIHYLNIVKDITDQKKSEDMIQMLTYAVNTSSDSVFLIDTEDASIFYVNDTAAKILGYPKEELIGGMRVFDIDPDFNNMDINQKFISELEKSGGIVFETKHRSKEGRIYPVEISSSFIKLEDKNYALAISRDISAEKEADEKLKLLASVFTHAKEGIVITDNEANILNVNETYTQITGYSKEELIGVNTRILKSGKHDSFFYQKMWEELKQNFHWSGEIWNRRKNGESFLERLVISAITDSEGSISSYVGLQTDITVLKEYENKLEKMAFYDALTQLPNRVLLGEKIHHATLISKRFGYLIAVCYLDLDGFKPVNDTYGHSFGDELLVAIAERMHKSVRESDTVARMGGDEFALLLVNVKSKRGCEKIIKKILKQINEPYILTNGMSVSITASVGITLFPDDNSTPDMLLRRADQAMYIAKESGKNRYIFHT